MAGERLYGPPPHFKFSNSLHLVNPAWKRLLRLALTDCGPLLSLGRDAALLHPQLRPLQPCPCWPGCQEEVALRDPGGS